MKTTCSELNSVLFCSDRKNYFSIQRQGNCPSSALMFGKYMKRTLIKNLTISAIIISVLLIGQSSAQETAPKNFRYSPNPKTKAEPSANIPKNEVSKTSEIPNIAKVAKTEEKLPDLSEKIKVGSEPKNNDENVVSKTEETIDNNSVVSKAPEVVKTTIVVPSSPTETYKVGLGDVLFISLENAPNKDASYFTVLRDGTIDYPLAGEVVSVTGLTIEQIEAMLEEKIKLYESPQVSVKVRERNSHIVKVAGLVENSGELMIERDALPLFVIKAKAVVSSDATKVSIKREGTETQTLDLKDYKTSEVLIFPGDIIEFSANEAEPNNVSQFYFIGGEINTGGRKDYIQGLTLTQAILESGGLKRSNIRKVVVRRTNTDGKLVSTEYDLKAIKDGKVINPVLEAGDEIVVGN